MANEQSKSTFVRGNARVLAALPLCSLVALAACAPTQPAAGPTASTTEETVTYTVPSVTAAVEGTEMQEKKNVVVSVVPDPFVVADTPSKDCVPGPDQGGGSILGGLVSINKDVPTKKPYIVTSTSGTDFQPKRLTFQITLTNRTDQVMHLNDIIPRLNINSEDVELSEADASKFSQGIVLPGDHKVFKIAGPDWSHNKDQSVITFQLNGVPTEIDKAGTISQREIFNFTFKAKLETKTTTTQKKVENLMLDPSEAASMGCHPGAATAAN